MFLFYFKTSVDNFFCKHTFSLSIFCTVTCNKSIDTLMLLILFCLKLSVQLLNIHLCVTSLFIFSEWPFVLRLYLLFNVEAIFALPPLVHSCQTKTMLSLITSYSSIFFWQVFLILPNRLCAKVALPVSTLS